MKKKTSYAVFTKTDSGLDYMIKSNFGNDEIGANNWSENHVMDLQRSCETIGEMYDLKYPNGLFVKKIEY